MMTREEQITMLEEQLDTLIKRQHTFVMDDRNPGEFSRGRAMQIEAVVKALTYLRTVIPNPYGRADPTSPRTGRRLDL